MFTCASCSDHNSAAVLLGQQLRHCYSFTAMQHCKLTACACWRPPFAGAAVQALKAAMMARWSLFVAAVPAVRLRLAAAASALLSGGDTNTERPCAMAATMVKMGSTHLQEPLHMSRNVIASVRWLSEHNIYGHTTNNPCKPLARSIARQILKAFQAGLQTDIRQSA